MYDEREIKMFIIKHRMIVAARNKLEKENFILKEQMQGLQTQIIILRNALNDKRKKEKNGEKN